MPKHETLNSSQLEAVQFTQGRLLILAGAGSGKTRVIIHRIAHLISHCGIDPKMILGLTFTNKAAREMRERLGKMLPPAVAKNVLLCTFHSFCMQVLRQDIHHLGYTENFSLYDEKDVQRLVQGIAKDILKMEADLPSLSPTLAAIHAAQAKGGEIQEQKSWHDNFSKDVYVRLKDCMRAYNAVDFDSLISLTLQLFTEHPAVLTNYQERYRYIMIDEYQDTNPAQFRLAELLAGRYSNLCVVGDDDQSIYGWRGSDVKNILHFNADKVIKLQENYRSTRTILDAANAVIAHNKNRHEKSLHNKGDKGEEIIVFHAPNEIDEAEGVVARILDFWQNKGIPLHEIAVLYRSNALSRNIEMALLQASYKKDGSWVRGIPYDITGGLEFTERSEIKDLSSYLRVIANPADQEALLRIINVPRRGISDKTLDLLTTYQRQKDLPLWSVLEDNPLDLPAKAKSSIQQFVQLMQTARHRFAAEPLHQAMQWFLEQIQYQKAILEEAKSDKMQQFKWENVQEFVSSLAQYEEQHEAPSLQDFVSNSLLGSHRPPSLAEKQREHVQLMTFHSAKGLEFSVCFLIGLEDQIVPHEKGMQETGLEEERRLFYVAMTRAKEKLIFSMARQRKRMGKDAAMTPSRFLFEIPKALYKLMPWKI